MQHHHPHQKNFKVSKKIMDGLTGSSLQWML